MVLTLVDKNDSLFAESWQLPTGSRTTTTSKKDKQYFLDYNVTPFKSQKIIPGKKYPFWCTAHLGKMKKTGYLRYCMERELAPDFSNEAFDKMPGYHVYSIELKEVK